MSVEQCSQVVTWEHCSTDCGVNVHQGALKDYVGGSTVAFRKKMTTWQSTALRICWGGIWTYPCNHIQMSSLFFSTFSYTALLYLQQMVLLGFMPQRCFEATSVELHREQNLLKDSLPTELKRRSTWTILSLTNLDKVKHFQTAIVLRILRMGSSSARRLATRRTPFATWSVSRASSQPRSPPWPATATATANSSGARCSASSSAWRRATW